MQWLKKYLSTTIEIKKYGVGNHGLETNNVKKTLGILSCSQTFANLSVFVGYRMWT